MIRPSKKARHVPLRPLSSTTLWQPQPGKLAFVRNTARTKKGEQLVAGLAPLCISYCSKSWLALRRCSTFLSPCSHAGTPWCAARHSSHCCWWPASSRCTSKVRLDRDSNGQLCPAFARVSLAGTHWYKHAGQTAQLHLEVSVLSCSRSHGKGSHRQG